MGLTVTEEIVWRGHRAVFLRANTEHHTIALYPLALRAELGLRADSICMAYGMQVGSYRQLSDAVAFLKSNGVTIKYLPPELFPGIDYSAFALDPEGNAIQLYYYMEQIGWDGRPRPARRAARWTMTPGPMRSTRCPTPIAVRCSRDRSAGRLSGFRPRGRKWRRDWRP